MFRKTWLTAFLRCGGLHRANREVLGFSVSLQLHQTQLLGSLEQIIERLKPVRTLVEARIAPVESRLNHRAPDSIIATFQFQGGQRGDQRIERLLACWTRALPG